MKTIISTFCLCVVLSLSACHHAGGSAAQSTDTTATGSGALPASQNGDSTLDSAKTPAHLKPDSVAGKK